MGLFFVKNLIFIIFSYIIYIMRLHKKNRTVLRDEKILKKFKKVLAFCILLCYTTWACDVQICVDAGGGQPLSWEISAEYVRF